jgi:hypothetical protein
LQGQEQKFLLLQSESNKIGPQYHLFNAASRKKKGGATHFLTEKLLIKKCSGDSPP